VVIEKGLKLLTLSSLTGMDHRILNFSKLGEKGTVLAHIVDSEVHRKPRICGLVHLPLTEPGDVLLISNTGAYGPLTRRGTNQFEFAPYHYLRARKMCPVPS
jgi:diaminopimelate decarboxylase/aspartate kinase